MFLDEKQLEIRAGKGGDGAVLFRREKYVPRGGPDGGDGGKGGHVFVEGKSNLHALTHLAYLRFIHAEDGKIGGHRQSTGKSGESVTIQVPLGTVVQEQLEDGSFKDLHEIIAEGEPLRIARGGNGGWGNWRFKSSVQQAPDHANAGQAGEEKVIRFVLKLIADIGLVGLPNAGKSTLLSVVSAARPKIANYPFTTLEPQLGVAQIGKTGDVHQVVIADLPGLIEGASQGKGLGHAFLKHVERTREILHCIDVSASPEEVVASYRTVRAELEQFSPALAAKAERICLTKSELVTAEEAAERADALRAITTSPISLVSAAAGVGIKELLTDL